MSRRARARHAAMEAKYIALQSDDDDPQDWEDADFDSLRLYDEISEDSASSQSLS